MLTRRTITTRSGLEVDGFDLKPGNVDIHDIAHALAMNCRFNGHSAIFYLVAERRAHAAIASVFGLPPVISAAVDAADKEAFRLEYERLLRPGWRDRDLAPVQGYPRNWRGRRF